MPNISSYEKVIRRRFPFLAQDTIWPAVKALIDEDWRDSDEFWFDGVQQHCIDLCKRLGLPFGPAHCNWCEEPFPEAGDVPDAGPCPRCKAADDAKKLAEAKHKAWYEALSPEQKKEYDDAQPRMYLAGLFGRNVQ